MLPHLTLICNSFPRFLTYAQQAAPVTAYQPLFCGDIQPYLPRTLAVYDAQATQASVPQRTWHERSLVWQQQCARLQTALPCAALVTLAVTQRTRLVTAGTPVWTLGLAGCVALDETLEAQASLPACDTWQQTQEGA